MKKATLLLLLILFMSVELTYSQMIVFDPSVVSTLVINHTAQQNVLKKIKTKESETAAAQKIITTQLETIKQIEQKIYKGLSTVEAIIRQSKDVVYASRIATDIGRYQGQMFDYAKEDPKLLLVAVKAETELINRTADLMTYIATAFIDGDINLMDNKQRLELIMHVVDELRVMRGIAYGIARQIRLAKRVGVMAAINPYAVKMIDNRAAIVKGILDDL